LSNYWTIYFSNFFPLICFLSKNQKVIDEFNDESEEIHGLSSLVEIHKRLEKIEVLQLEHIIHYAGITTCSSAEKFVGVQKYIHEI